MPKSVNTEFTFTLPKGLVDSQGRIHTQGVMRLATARDEIEAQKHREVRENPPYGVLVLLASVITRLGSFSAVKPQTLENLFSLDLAYLREFYNRINQQGDATVPTQCPQCQAQFAVELSLAGES
ncbi:phage tail assembly protein [Anthocerotibacter panamensis]|uniref:phage tail assembly protein n=1 Tax=Anthocerotibacter panamensis TaxID=2857077 RepID=UPI001C40365C